MDLKPCPFCKSTVIQFKVFYDIYCETYYMLCENCKSSGPKVYKSGNEVYAAWNDRK